MPEEAPQIAQVNSPEFETAQVKSSNWLMYGIIFAIFIALAAAGYVYFVKTSAPEQSTIIKQQANKDEATIQDEAVDTSDNAIDEDIKSLDKELQDMTTDSNNADEGLKLEQAEL